MLGGGLDIAYAWKVLGGGLDSCSWEPDVVEELDVVRHCLDIGVCRSETVGVREMLGSLEVDPRNLDILDSWEVMLHWFHVDGQERVAVEVWVLLVHGVVVGGWERFVVEAIGERCFDLGVRQSETVGVMGMLENLGVDSRNSGTPVVGLGVDACHSDTVAVIPQLVGS